MKREVIGVLLALAGLALAAALPAPAFCQGKPAAQGAREKIAVLDLEGVGASESETAALSERLREVILKTGRFSMVNRSQMNRILEEQAFQQAGCTGQNCAVQVGRILGVRKIVAGKAVKVADGMWLLSAALLDAETAETLKAESIRHQGNFFDLLEGGVATLAASLTGTAAPPRAARSGAVAPRGAAPPLRSSGAASGGKPGLPLKLAVFPTRFLGHYAKRAESKHGNVIRDLDNMAQRSKGRVELAYSYYPTPFNPKLHEDFRRTQVFVDVKEKSWEGFLVRSPNERFIYRAGRALGVDLVMVHQLRLDREGGQVVREFRVFLFDVNNLKAYQRAGHFEKGKGRKMLDRTRVKLFRQYWKEAHAGG